MAKTAFERLMEKVKAAPSSTAPQTTTATTTAAPQTTTAAQTAISGTKTENSSGTEAPKKELTVKERCAIASYNHTVLDILFSEKGGLKFHNVKTGIVINAVPEAAEGLYIWDTVDGMDYMIVKLKNGKRQLISFDGKEVKVSPHVFDNAKIEDGEFYFEQGGRVYHKPLKAPKPDNTPVEFTGNLF